MDLGEPWRALHTAVSYKSQGSKALIYILPYSILP